MAFSFVITMSMKEDDPAASTIRRSTRIAERNSVALKRIINRYEAIIQNTPPPPSEYVNLLYTVFCTHIQFRASTDYLARDTVINMVRRSTLPSDSIQSLISYLDRISFAEYAKLLEAVEMM